MSIVHYHGARRDTYDERDFKKYYDQEDIPLKSSHPNNIIDLSKYVVEVYDQGHLGSCAANALCAAYGLDLEKQSETLKGGYTYFKPSRLFLYYNTRECNNEVDSDSGAGIRDTVKALNRKGVCKESKWPYVTKEFKRQPPQLCYDDAVGNNLCRYESLEQDIDQFRACLKDSCPFFFGFQVYDSFYKVRNDGVMPMPTSQEVGDGPKGLHAVVAVGYDDSTKQIKVLNSWGSKWGDNGYFYMPYDFIKDDGFCLDFWKISFACQRDKPRPKDADQGSSESISSPSVVVGGTDTRGPIASYGSYGEPSRRSSRYCMIL